MAGENLGTIYYSVEVETEQLIKGTASAEKQLDKTEQAMTKVDKASEGLRSNLSKLSLAFAAIASARALSQMAQMVQKYQEYADRVRLATSSTEEFDRVQERLLATANGTYRSLGEAQELYIRTAASLRSMGYSTEQALDVTDSMSYAFVKNATSADRAASATDALSKSITTGKVAADQWETITSAIPTVIDDIATASGRTAAEVRKLGAQGKLTARDLTEGLRNSLDENAKAAAGMSNNLTDAAVRTRTAITQVLVSLENQTGALQAFTNGIIGAADAVLAFGTDNEKMASFLQLATTAAAALGSVIAGRLISSMGAYAVAQAQALSAAIAKIAVDREAAALAVTAARNDLAAAEAAMARAKAMQAAAVGSSQFNAATVALAQSTLQYETAAKNVATAVANQGRVAGVTTIAMNGLRSVMGLLGGPAGVILLAATALYTFATNAKSARTETDSLNGSLDKLTFNQLGRAANEVTEDVQGLNKELAAARNNFNTASRRPFESDDSFAKRQVELRAALDDVNQRLAERDARLKDIKAAQDALAAKSLKQNNPGPAGATPPTPPDEESAKVIKGLEEQQALLKVIGVERAKLAAIQKLGEGASPEQRQEAERLAASIYNLEQAEAKQKAASKKGESEAAQLAKKTADERKRGAESNLEVFRNLGLEISAVDLKTRDLAMRQAELSLNEYATPQQVEQVRALAGALFDLRQRKADLQTLGQVDPIVGAQQGYEAELAKYQQLNDAKLLSDQRYLELKGQLDAEHAATLQQLEEQRFAQQSKGNAMLIDTLNQVQTAGTSALVGLATGASNGTEAVQQLGAALLNEVVGSLVQVGVQYLKNLLIQQAAGNAAVGATVAQAGTAAAAWAPAAAAASIGTLGGAAGIGLSAIAAILPSITGLFGGGRKAGGPVNAGTMYRVNEGGAPEVFNAGGQQYMIPNIRGEVVSNRDATNGAAGSGGAGTTVNIHNNNGSNVRTSSKQMDRQEIIDVFIDDYMNGGQTSKAISTGTGTKRRGT